MTMNPYYKSKVRNETRFSEILTELQEQCGKFDTYYCSSDSLETKMFHIDVMESNITNADENLERTYTDVMRPDFIYHEIKYTCFELKILGQKLTQFVADENLQQALLHRQNFYRYHKDKLHSKLSGLENYDVDLTLPVPAETERDLSWLLQETLKCQPRHEGHALQ
jgi:hypothetical protein